MVRIAASVVLAIFVGVAAQATRAQPTQTQFKLFEVRIDGKGRHALFTGDPAIAPEGIADVSRDGRRALFVNVGDIYVSDIDGSHTKRIAINPNPVSVPVLSPDGRRVAFQSEYDCAEDGFCYERDVRLVKTDGTGLRRFSEQAIAPSWTADSRKLFYFAVPHAGLSQAGAVTIAKVTGRFRPRTLVANEQATDGESTLRVSPRGDRVAYTRDVQGGGGKEIRIARMDGRTQTFLGSQPSWSPDGTRLAFTSSRFPTSVYVGRPGGRRRWLSAGSRPVWSPDGRWIAFVRGSRCAQINVIRPSGRGRRQVTHEPCGSGFDIWWSPDSKRLIYQRFG